mgnify:FL=1
MLEFRNFMTNNYDNLKDVFDNNSATYNCNTYVMTCYTTYLAYEGWEGELEGFYPDDYGTTGLVSGKDESSLSFEGLREVAGYNYAQVITAETRRRTGMGTVLTNTTEIPVNQATYGDLVYIEVTDYQYDHIVIILWNNATNIPFIVEASATEDFPDRLDEWNPEKTASGHYASHDDFVDANAISFSDRINYLLGKISSNIPYYKTNITIRRFNQFIQD